MINRSYKRYIESTDEIRTRVPKGRKDDIKAHARSMGEPVGVFILRAIEETMARDVKKKEQDRKRIDKILENYEKKRKSADSHLDT